MRGGPCPACIVTPELCAGGPCLTCMCAVLCPHARRSAATTTADTGAGTAVGAAAAAATPTTTTTAAAGTTATAATAAGRPGTALGRSFRPAPAGAQPTTSTIKASLPPGTTPAARPGRPHKYCGWRCFLFMLTALCTGAPLHPAAAMWGVAPPHITKVSSTYVCFTYRAMRREQPRVSSARCRNRMPGHWANTLKTNRVKIVLDATEFTCQGSSLLPRARVHYSNYKKNYTIKFLVGVAAHGAIVFVSHGYPGKITDYQITEVCGVLDWIEGGGLVLAGRGFNIAS